MPNISGGDQHHPAYDPREAEAIRGDPRRHLIGNTLYTIHGEGDEMYVTYEDVDGSRGCAYKKGMLMDLPAEVTEAMRKIRATSK